MFPCEAFRKGEIWDDKENKCVTRRGRAKIAQTQLQPLHICKRVGSQLFPVQKDHKTINDYRSRLKYQK